MKPVRTIFAPVILPMLPRKSFIFRGQSLPYLLHRYNMTWASERCIEVPIARSLLDGHDPGATLEVGNVLSHYGSIEHEVLDKFERGARVINADIIEFKPPKDYELIFSISTFEHIGYDDEAQGSSAEKISQAVSACQKLLREGGRLVITAPIGYNPDLDRMLRDNTLSPTTESYLKKFGTLDWKECSKEEALQCQYRHPFPYANAVVVAELARP